METEFSDNYYETRLTCRSGSYPIAEISPSTNSWAINIIKAKQVWRSSTLAQPICQDIFI
jgi:hypothetical protein